MSHKSKRYYKKKKKKYIEDTEVIELLNIQLLSLIIFVVSDVLFYKFAILSLQQAYEQNKESDFAYPYIIAMKAIYLALEASAINSKVDFIVYDKINKQKIQGNIEHSVEPERKIAIGSIYTILFFYFNLIAIIQIFNQQVVYNTMIDKKFIPLIKMQLIAYILRIIGDYFAIIATMEGIDLIKSKYDGREGKNMRNPDILALLSARIYLVERIILFYANYRAYLYTLESSNQTSNTRAVTRANLIRVMGNIIGVYGGIITLYGFEELYRRNSVLPVFGR